MGKSRKSKSWVRRSVQIFFFIVVALIAVNHSLEEAGSGIEWLSSASLHAVCPFGGVVSIYQYLTQGTFVKKIHESAFILMIIVALLAVAFGPVFCGWICPLGSFQEWISRIGKRLFKKKHNTFLPQAVDMPLRYLRYGVLAWVIYMTARSGTLVFSDFDPYYALFNFWTGEVAISGLVVLGLVMLLSLFVERPFCKYACPYGAVLGISNLFRVFAIKRNPVTCIDCKACDKSCPMNISVSDKKTIRHHQCISCLECTSERSCPVANTALLASSAPGASGKSIKEEAA